MSYKILLFDADNTLFDFDAAAKLAFFDMACKYGFAATDENYNIYEKINLDCWHEIERGGDKQSLLLKRFATFFDAIGINGDVPAINQDYLTALSQKGILYDGTVNLLSTLKTHGKRLFLITNGVEIVQKGRLDQSNLAHYFENIFISEKMGVSKPHKRFFDLVEQQIPHFNKQEALVIGDSLTGDIAGANNAGLHCIWFNNKNMTAPANYAIDYTATTHDEVLQYILKN